MRYHARIAPRMAIGDVVGSSEDSRTYREQSGFVKIGYLPQSDFRSAAAFRCSWQCRPLMPRMYGCMDRLPFASEGVLAEVADMYPACCSARGPWPWWEYARTV